MSFHTVHDLFNDTPKLPLKVKKVYQDGRCLFRSVAVACDDALLSCVRNEGGWPTGVNLAKQETEKVDQLKKERFKCGKPTRKYMNPTHQILGKPTFGMIVIKISLKELQVWKNLTHMLVNLKF